MSDFDVKEKRFEEDIEDYLTHHGGYTKGDPKKFNRESGLEEDTFVEFIKTSQPKKWERYVKIYAENSEKQIIERFKREVKTTNLLNVMRHGFMDRGIKFYPIFWKPETSLNETTQMQYDANILHCTRQLHYSVHNENSIDIVLFANGIPVVSMELKCQFTGQDTTNAINQYKFDRAGKDAIFAFKERVLVHFAVDLTNVYMTTRLEGAHTYFLPFNQGSNGAGKVGGKGNPVNPNGYDTAYLWERVLCKDSLMEILQKYMHLQQEYDKNGNLVKETMIFPRYHQLDVVTKLLEDVKKNGSGKSYLIQHSAGSGKSNSIAWLAHRLTGLHDYEDNKIFQSVIIVTDRRVLDSQLQSTVYQLSESLKEYISRIIKIHRLREVRVLTGFTRLEAPEPEVDEQSHIVKLKCSSGEKWLPAVEINGEGVFIELNKEKINQWMQIETVKSRSDKYEECYAAYCQKKGWENFKPRNAEYVLLHTLSHMLIKEMSMQSGYSSSALHERIYSSENMCGILIYTGAADKEGSLGGLVELGGMNKFLPLLKGALENGLTCTTDPECFMKNPTSERLNGAACHSCTMISETACENGNRLLDRALVVPVPEHEEMGYFRELVRDLCGIQV